MSPQRPALLHEDSAWTYAELSADIARLAQALSELGVRAGDRVGYLGPNHPAYLRTFFAAGLLGAIFVPLNHRLSASELVYVVQDAGCLVVVYGAESSALVEEVRARTRVREWVAAGSVDGAQRLLGELLAGAPSDLVDLPVGLDDLCFLIYTSGTTGQPKGVMLTHGNVTWNALNYLSTTDFRTDDVTLAIAPLFRAGGWGVTLLPTLQKGGTVVLVSDFDPAGVLELIARHRVTTLFGGPELLTALPRTPEWISTDLSSIRFVVSGGDVVHESLIRAYQDRGLAFLQGYGLTEAGPMALMLDEQDALRKLGSAGRPPLFVDVRIARGDLSTAEAGEVGEILVRGPNVMRGYWRRPEDSEAALVQGWLRTGDAGRMDEEGYVYVDRPAEARLRLARADRLPGSGRARADRPRGGRRGRRGGGERRTGRAGGSRLRRPGGPRARDRRRASRALPRATRVAPGAGLDRVPGGAAEERGRQGRQESSRRRGPGRLTLSPSRQTLTTSPARPTRAARRRSRASPRAPGTLPAPCRPGDRSVA